MNNLHNQYRYGAVGLLHELFTKVNLFRVQWTFYAAKPNCIESVKRCNLLASKPFRSFHGSLATFLALSKCLVWWRVKQSVSSHMNSSGQALWHICHWIIRQSPTMVLEPMTTRLRALRSTISSRQVPRDFLRGEKKSYSQLSARCTLPIFVRDLHNPIE